MADLAARGVEKLHPNSNDFSLFSF